MSGRHRDEDGDGRADHGAVDQRDEHAVSDDACDPEQAQPERWVGVTREHEALPVGEVPDA